MVSVLSVLELEITGRCQLRCLHCYAESSPDGGHRSMTVQDWCGVITDAASLGVSRVQLIGGEPTLHPDFTRLLGEAVSAGLSVEVYSNLVHVTDAWWELFTTPGVSLATSYYSDRASEHEAVTGRRRSHARTRANIAEAVRRGIPVRAGIIRVLDDQRVEEARSELAAMGVNVGIDRMRGIGRGMPAGDGVTRVGELCGRCGRGRAAVSPEGDVWPCVLSRWLRAGNVRQQPLAEILAGPRWRDLVATIPTEDAYGCHPSCKPSMCDGTDCHPAERDACEPDL